MLFLRKYNTQAGFDVCVCVWPPQVGRVVCSYGPLNVGLVCVQVDLLSLDVEGSETAILQTLPWSSLHVSLLLVEHHGEGAGRDAAFHDYITYQGYKLFDHYTDEVGVTDYVFVHRGYWEQHWREIERRRAAMTDMGGGRGGMTGKRDHD